jgi:hypothetical protein
MAGSIAAPYPDEVIRLWNRFQDVAEARVREGNLVAGEPLWEILKSPGAAGELIIRSIQRPATCVECRLNLRESVLTSKCTGAPALRFELRGEGVRAPGTENARIGIEQIVTLILDQLVWVDDWDALAAPRTKA